MVAIRIWYNVNNEKPQNKSDLNKMEFYSLSYKRDLEEAEIAPYEINGKNTKTLLSLMHTNKSCSA